MKRRQFIAPTIAAIACLALSTACGGSEKPESGTIATVTHVRTGCKVELQPAEGKPHTVKHMFICDVLRPGITYRSNDGETSFLLDRTRVMTDRRFYDAVGNCLINTKYVDLSGPKPVDWDATLGWPKKLHGTPTNGYCLVYTKGKVVERTVVWSRYITQV